MKREMNPLLIKAQDRVLASMFYARWVSDHQCHRYFLEEVAVIRDPSYFEDPDDLPDYMSEGRGDTEQLDRRGSKREMRELARLMADAGESPEGEVLHDPDSVPLVRSKRDAELAMLGMDPDSLYPCCDWCEEEVSHGLKPEQKGRW